MILYSTDVKLPYETVCTLVNNGSMRLGIDNDKAEKFLNTTTCAYLISGTSIYMSFRIYLWLALVVIGISIYFSFTYAWWMFICGILGASCISYANKKVLARRMLSCSLKDKELYSALVNFGALMYDIKDEEIARQDIEVYK